MGRNNSNLLKAKKAKNDEFYTRLEDIEKELVWYKDYFKDKIVYCNCDDFRESNFPKFFKDKFNELCLRKVISTNLDRGNGAWKWEYDGTQETIVELQGDGSFKSQECKDLLDSCDIVCTNPPFSLFREYIGQLFQYGKKFLIIGPASAVHFKEIFPYIKNNQLWWGVSPRGFNFSTPDKSGCSVNAVWYTNLEYRKRRTQLELYKKYNPTDYPKYDNFNAIEVSKTCDIPEDYTGVMGVPITFLDKYCPEQFELIGLINNGKINGKEKYSRIAIKRK